MNDRIQSIADVVNLHSKDIKKLAEEIKRLRSELKSTKDKLWLLENKGKFDKGDALSDAINSFVRNR